MMDSVWSSSAVGTPARDGATVSGEDRLGLRPVVEIHIPGQMKQAETESAIARAFTSLVGRSDRSVGSILFDMAGTSYCDIATLVWSVLQLAEWRQRGWQIRLRLPTIEVSDAGVADPPSNVGFWSFLIRWGFFRVLARLVDDPVNLLDPVQASQLGPRGSTPPWMRYRRGRVQNILGQSEEVLSEQLLEMESFVPASGSGDLIESDFRDFLDAVQEGRIVAQALVLFSEWRREDAQRLVETVMVESLNNTAVHAHANVALTAMKIDDRQMTVAVADNGTGIPAAMRNGWTEPGVDPSTLRDSVLIQQYTEPKVVLDSFLIQAATLQGTTTEQGRRGWGLWYLKQAVLNAGGELRIRSGQASVEFATKATTALDDLDDWHGTCLRIRVPISAEERGRRLRRAG